MPEKYSCKRWLFDHIVLCFRIIMRSCRSVLLVALAMSETIFRTVLESSRRPCASFEHHSFHAFSLWKLHILMLLSVIKLKECFFCLILGNFIYHIITSLGNRQSETKLYICVITWPNTAQCIYFSFAEINHK